MTNLKCAKRYTKYRKIQMDRLVAIVNMQFKLEPFSPIGDFVF